MAAVVMTMVAMVKTAKMVEATEMAAAVIVRGTPLDLSSFLFLTLFYFYCLFSDF
jgi:hypothetical protein